MRNAYKKHFFVTFFSARLMHQLNEIVFLLHFESVSEFFAIRFEKFIIFQSVNYGIIIIANWHWLIIMFTLIFSESENEKLLAIFAREIKHKTVDVDNFLYILQFRRNRLFSRLILLLWIIIDGNLLRFFWRRKGIHSILCIKIKCCFCRP